MDVETLENNIDNFLTELRDSEISQSSSNVYKSNINRFIKYLKNKNIQVLDKNSYIDYRDFLLNEKKYKISTINKYVVVLNKYLSYLDHNELKIKQLRFQKKHYTENVPTTIDYKRILRSAKKNDELTYYFILIASYTGMRVSAIREITIEALKESKKNDDYIKIHSKGKFNEVPFPAWLRRELLNYAKKNGITSGYIFLNPKTGKPFVRKTLWKRVHKITGLARVDLSKGHPHAFRHLFGKEITGFTGNDNLVVADILGHESTKTTEQYQQKSKKEISKIVNEFRFK